MNNPIKSFIRAIMRRKYGLRGALKPPLRPNFGTFVPMPLSIAAYRYRRTVKRIEDRIYRWTGLPVEWERWRAMTEAKAGPCEARRSHAPIVLVGAQIVFGKVPHKPLLLADGALANIPYVVYMEQREAVRVEIRGKEYYVQDKGDYWQVALESPKPQVEIENDKLAGLVAAFDDLRRTRHEAAHWKRRYHELTDVHEELRRQYEATVENRNLFCHEINVIGKEIIGPRINSFKGDNCAAQAVTREVKKYIEKLELKLLSYYVAKIKKHGPTIGVQANIDSDVLAALGDMAVDDLFDALRFELYKQAGIEMPQRQPAAKEVCENCGDASQEMRYDSEGTPLCPECFEDYIANPE